MGVTVFTIQEKCAAVEGHIMNVHECNIPTAYFKWKFQQPWRRQVQSQVKQILGSLVSYTLNVTIMW